MSIKIAKFEEVNEKFKKMAETLVEMFKNLSTFPTTKEYRHQKMIAQKKLMDQRDKICNLTIETKTDTEVEQYLDFYLGDAFPAVGGHRCNNMYMTTDTDISFQKPAKKAVKIRPFDDHVEGALVMYAPKELCWDNMFETLRSFVLKGEIDPIFCTRPLIFVNSMNRAFTGNELIPALILPVGWIGYYSFFANLDKKRKSFSILSLLYPVSGRNMFVHDSVMYLLHPEYKKVIEVYLKENSTYSDYDGFYYPKLSYGYELKDMNNEIVSIVSEMDIEFDVLEVANIIDSNDTYKGHRPMRSDYVIVVKQKMEELGSATMKGLLSSLVVHAENNFYEPPSMGMLLSIVDEQPEYIRCSDVVKLKNKKERRLDMPNSIGHDDSRMTLSEINRMNDYIDDHEVEIEYDSAPTYIVCHMRDYDGGIAARGKSRSKVGAMRAAYRSLSSLRRHRLLIPNDTFELSVDNELVLEAQYLANYRVEDFVYSLAVTRDPLLVELHVESVKKGGLIERPNNDFIKHGSKYVSKYLFMYPKFSEFIALHYSKKDSTWLPNYNYGDYAEYDLVFDNNEDVIEAFNEIDDIAVSQYEVLKNKLEKIDVSYTLFKQVATVFLKNPTIRLGKVHTYVKTTGKKPSKRDVNRLLYKLTDVFVLHSSLKLWSLDDSWKEYVHGLVVRESSLDW